jgi:hypothetical protein
MQGKVHSPRELQPVNSRLPYNNVFDYIDNRLRFTHPPDVERDFFLAIEEFIKLHLDRPCHMSDTHKGMLNSMYKMAAKDRKERDDRIDSYERRLY